VPSPTCIPVQKGSSLSNRKTLYGVNVDLSHECLQN
jgi:hypothetical protein